MTRDTLLLTAVLLAAGLASPTFADDDPPSAAAEAEPADSDTSAIPWVPEEQDEPPDKPATFERSDDEIKVFSLQNVSPAEVVLQLQVLFPESVKLSAVPSRKTVIARGPADELEKVEALLLRLDEARPAPPSDFGPATPPPTWSPAPAKGSGDIHRHSADDYDPYVIRREEFRDHPPARDADKATGEAEVPEAFRGPYAAWWEKHTGGGRNLSVEALRTEFEQLDAKARELARSKRRSRESEGSGSGDVKDLRDAVRKAFDARQALQRRELAELAERLAAIQKSLEARERMKDEIINRRVEELLNPALNWDNVPSRLRPDTTSASRSEERPISDDSDGIPLAAAIKAFNQRYANHPIGKDQPPLTEKEVVDAIRFWKFKRDDAPVSNAEFATFQRIAETRLLPTGFEFEVIPKFVGLDGETVDAWSVRIRMPAGEKGHTYAFVIRERFADSRVVPSETFPERKLEPLRTFDSSKSAAGSFVNVGVVFEVPGTRTVSISLEHAKSVEVGEQLELSRQSPVHPEQFERFAAVQVTAVEGDAASATLVATQREIVDNRYVWMTPQPGDHAMRPRPDDAKQSVKNLKQIMLALVNYHDVFSHFPPALVKGQQETGRSEHPHSWRVAILPYFGRPEWQALYDQYRFDEPWDSEHNKALLTKMPDVYRSPLDEADSISTSYFAVVTPHLPVGADTWKRGTLFSNPQGTPMREVTDGTSNTIAIVEAKRKVPWTKPEDIPFNVDGPLPALGGWLAEGFHAGFADGSVQFVSKENDAQTLRHLLLIQDGAVVEPKFVE